jgi:hypothetical protein
MFLSTPNLELARDFEIQRNKILALNGLIETQKNLILSSAEEAVGSVWICDRVQSPRSEK